MKGQERPRQRTRAQRAPAFYGPEASHRPHTLLLLVSDQSAHIEEVLAAEDGPVLLATSKKHLRERYRSGKVAIFETGKPVTTGFNALTDLKELLLSAYFDGHIGSGEKLLVQFGASDGTQGLLFFDMEEDQSIASLRRELEFRVDPKIVEKVITLCTELAREGREKGHIGALFVVGDTDRVLAESRQVVLNPFEGHAEAARGILDGNNWETAKEFAQIDGAFIVDEQGRMVAAGRYVNIKSPVELPSGLGGRHLASAAVTKQTRAVAVTLSETGVIRVFKDGEIMFKIGIH